MLSVLTDWLFGVWWMEQSEPMGFHHIWINTATYNLHTRKKTAFPFQQSTSAPQTQQQQKAAVFTNVQFHTMSSSSLSSLLIPTAIPSYWCHHWLWHRGFSSWVHQPPHTYCMCASTLLGLRRGGRVMSRGRRAKDRERDRESVERERDDVFMSEAGDCNICLHIYNTV